MDTQESEKQQTNSDQAATTPVSAEPAALATNGFGRVERITAIVLMVSGVLFAIIGIAAIWGAFDDNGDVVWRSLGSLAVVALAALIVNVGARTAEGRK